MTGTVLGSGVNIILDPIFIFVLGLGAAGAAIATVLGNICADIFFVWFLLKKSKKLSVNPLGFHISADEISQIMAIGFPASITNFMQSFGIALMNRFLLPYGNERVAAMGIVMKINMIAVLILVGMPFIAVVLVTTCIFQSAGKAWNAFLLSVSRQGVLFAVVILLAARLAGYYGVLMAQAVSDLLTALLAVWLFWRGLYRVIWEK